MPEPLDDALAALRPLLLDTDHLVRAVAAGRRRGVGPATARAQLRVVDLAAGRRLQVTTTDGVTPLVRNHAPGADAQAAVDALLTEPFGNWMVETDERVVQLRVTKKGLAQVHSAPTSRRDVARATAHDRPKEHLLEPDDPIFAALGAGADKRRQVDAFLRQLQAATKTLLAQRDPAPPLHVVDLGCGNAYLTVAAHRWLAGRPELRSGGVRTVGVEIRPDRVARNTALAAELGLTGLTFVTGTIADADPGLGRVDVALALHACDTATDEALARGVRWAAPVLLAAPCCHHDVQRQLAAHRSAGDIAPPFAGLTRHPILSERFADVLTDAVRADLLRLLGYRVDVVEFVDSRHTPRNALIRAQRTAAPASARRRTEYTDLVTAWRIEPALAGMLAPEVAQVLA